MSIDLLYFGRDDAEMDIADGGLLRAGFLPTPAYDAARRARKHLIIGRKGSGKSAICRTLAAQDDADLITRLVTPDALSAEEIRRFELQGVEPGMAKRMLWRYVLATYVAKHLVAHTKTAHKKAPSAVARLQAFLIDNGELDVARPKLYEIVKRLKGSLKLQAFGVGVEVSGSSEGTRTDHQLEVVERHIEMAIEELACPADHPRLLLLVDQLEDVWSEEGESDSLVIGLLKASRAVGSRFARVSCVVFLRSDIYDLLRFPDKDKYHGDELRVDWTPERLHELVLARARASLGVDIGPEQLWGEIFPREVAGVPARDYLVGRTLLRPRDVIHLCNLCRDTAENNGHPVITEADVAEAVELYSQWKLEDLPNEYLANYPFLDGLLAVFKDRGYVVTRAGLERRLPEARQVLAGRFPERAGALNTENVLDVLYDIGFLGVGRNDHVVYAGRHGGRVEPADTEFQIHPAFRPALRATRASITWEFEPGRLRRLVRDTIASPRGGELRRGTFEYQSLRRAEMGVRRLHAQLDDAQLPREVRREVSSSLLDVLNGIEVVAGQPPTGHLSAQLDYIREFLQELARRLDADGFCENERGRHLIRSIEERARVMRLESRGFDPYGGGGSGSDG
jgi:hypothetical protein